MLLVAFTVLLLIGMTTAIHYEILRGLYTWLPGFRIPSRTKVLVVIFGAFVAHALEIAVYGLTFYVMVTYLGTGKLDGSHSISIAGYLYFSAETYTSLGFGDVTPDGPVRLLAGAEALNGLLLIGWSASFIYISMERFWVSYNHGRVP
jgi:prepilin signal peptidase PulO-like enzyme (type II secretory pathway)